MACMVPPGYAGIYCEPFFASYLVICYLLIFTLSRTTNTTPRSVRGLIQSFEILQDNQDEPYWNADSAHSRPVPGRQQERCISLCREPPLAISVKAFRTMLLERALLVGLLKLVLKHLLLNLDFLHIEAKVIHTGKSNKIKNEALAFYSSRFSIAVDVQTSPQISKRAVYCQ